jgi:hypothetical protein
MIAGSAIPACYILVKLLPLLVLSLRLLLHLVVSLSSSSLLLLLQLLMLLLLLTVTNGISGKSVNYAIVDISVAITAALTLSLSML